jgi:hypothetical protein
VKLTIPIRSISSSRGLRKILTTCREGRRRPFQELFIPFAAVATDADTGREFVMRTASSGARYWPASPCRHLPPSSTRAASLPMEDS